jgi:hypothetical protein
MGSSCLYSRRRVRARDALGGTAKHATDGGYGLERPSVRRSPDRSAATTDAAVHHSPEARRPGALDRIAGYIDAKREFGRSPTILDFFAWGIAECPAKNTMLVLWGHGFGLDDYLPTGVSPVSYPAPGASSTTLNFAPVEDQMVEIPAANFVKPTISMRTGPSSTNNLTRY